MGLSQGLRIIAEGETSQEREDNVINPTLIARGSLPCIVSHVLYASQSGNVSSRSTWTRKPTKSPSPSRCCRGCPSGSESVPPFRLLSPGGPGLAWLSKRRSAIIHKPCPKMIHLFRSNPSVCYTANVIKKQAKKQKQAKKHG